MCGENAADAAGESVSGGSPPRVRGKHPSPVLCLGHRRITPACAGKTHRLRQRRAEIQDHPRVCGENCEISRTVNSLLGSPPRVRGKHFVLGNAHPLVRITPACAGKTTFCSFSLLTGQDHPRVCGENSLKKPAYRRLPGSPPRVRGKLAHSTC